jgi:hypothetical protein
LNKRGYSAMHIAYAQKGRQIATGLLNHSCASQMSVSLKYRNDRGPTIGYTVEIDE